MTSANPLDSKRFWLRRAGYGLALGASIALLEFAYYYPLISTPDRLGAGLLASLLLTWCGEGVLLAVTVGLFELRQAPRPLGARQLALAVVVGSTAGVLAWQAFMQLVLRERFGIWLLRDYVGQPVEMAGIVLYNVWLMLVFGGLGSAVYLSRQRHARTLAVLRAAEFGRETSQRKLAEARLAALHARIDPDFVFQTLSKLERLYEADPPEADRVLEELIVFLRGALAEVRAAPAQ
jgi:predicted small integral membrane protein